MKLASCGVPRLVLVDGTCKTCKYRACDPGIDATVASVNGLLEAEGITLRVERLSEFPEELLVEETTGLFGVSRRGFFTQAKDVAKDAAEKAAVTALKKELQQKAPSLRDRLKMSDKGSLPQFNAMRRMHVLDARSRPRTARPVSSSSPRRTACNAACARISASNPASPSPTSF